MSNLQYTEAMNATDLQIWNNAAFDNGDSGDPATIKDSLCPMKPMFVILSESLDYGSSKENQSPVFVKSPVSLKSPAPVHPLHPNGAIENSQGKPTKLLLKQIRIENAVEKNGREEDVCDEKNIDKEIEEIEMEINRLSSKLEALRMGKAEQNVKAAERPGRVAPAKFMEHKQSVKNCDGVKKIGEISSSSPRTKVQRRGVSLGPSEIVAGVRRGDSLGPSEIVAAIKSRPLGKQEITPVQPVQNRRKSCFWKLQDIDEEDVKKERRKSSSLRQAATTVGPKKGMKKEEGVLARIQPKKLFKEGENSVPAKKSLRPGRVVASRYSQGIVRSTANLAENDKDDSKRCDKKRSISVGKSRVTLPRVSWNPGTESRVKKRWEIPSEVVVVHNNLVIDNSPPSATVIQDVLPRIRTARCPNDSPRDSGPAKRVAELIERKTYFSHEEEVEPSVCQALSSAEDVKEK